MIYIYKLFVCFWSMSSLVVFWCFFERVDSEYILLTYVLTIWHLFLLDLSLQLILRALNHVYHLNRKVNCLSRCGMVWQARSTGLNNLLEEYYLCFLCFQTLFRTSGPHTTIDISSDYAWKSYMLQPQVFPGLFFKN